MSDSMRLAFLYSEPLVSFDKDGAPHPVDRLDFEAERQCIFDCLGEAGKAVEIRVEAATAERLRTLVTLGCVALHYSGHGNPDYLVFEDGRGGTHAMDPEILRQLFAAGGPQSTQLVFVSACHSRLTAESFIAAGVPHVVAVRLESPVYDDAAREFARQFYLALVAGKSVQQAFDIGRSVIRAMPGLPSAATESEKFLLLPEGVDHNISVFAGAAPGQWHASTRSGSSNLPSGAEHFTGRNIETQAAVDAVLGSRLVTVKGAPGIGKTAVAIAAARYIAERRIFPEGVFFVPLREVRSAEAVRFSISTALQISIHTDEELFAALKSWQGLLLLDNCEDPLHHAPQEFRKFISKLLQQAGRLKLLLTSRQAVGGGLEGVAEKILPVRGLHHLDAAHLFMAIAPRPIAPSELGTDDPRTAIEQLANHGALTFLRGHPQAIALAAPLLQDKSLTQLYELLQMQNVDALAVEGVPEGERDAVTSLTVSLSTSVGYLLERNPESIRFFSMLSLLPAGGITQNFEAYWGTGWRSLMDALVRASLVERREIGNTEYFSTFPFVTAYARRLLNNQDHHQFAPRICKVLGEMSKQLYYMMGTERASTSYSLLALQEANFWACLEPGWHKGSTDHTDTSGSVSYLATYFPQLLLMADRFTDGLQAARLALAACEATGDKEAKGNVLTASGELKARLGDLQGARADYDIALSIFQQLHARTGEANTIYLRAKVALIAGQLEDALRDYNSALSICREINNLAGLANTLQGRGNLRIGMGDMQGAKEDFEEALPIFQKLNNRIGEASAYLERAKLRIWDGDLEGADTDLNSALMTYQMTSDPQGIASTLHTRGELKVKRGKLREALSDYNQALQLRGDVNDWLGGANILQSRGQLLMWLNDLDNAAADFERALQAYEIGPHDLGIANTIEKRAGLKARKGDWHGAIEDYNAALEIFERIQHPLGIATTLRERGVARYFMNTLELADADITRALGIFRQINDDLGEANSLRIYGELKVKHKDFDGAAGDYARAMAIYQNIRHRLNQANCWQAMGTLELERGNIEPSITHFNSALDLHLQVADLLGAAADVASVGKALGSLGHVGHAVLLFEAALGVHRVINDLRGQTMDLYFQAGTLTVMKLHGGALACLWQSLTISRAIKGHLLPTLEAMFAQKKAQMTKEAFLQMLKTLEFSAEQIRLEAVAAVRSATVYPLPYELQGVMERFHAMAQPAT